MKMIIAENWRN